MTRAQSIPNSAPRRVRWIGLLAAFLASVFAVAVATPATAEVVAPVAPADPQQCTRDGVLGAGESATNKTPYDPKTLKLEIDQAKLAHQASPNHITMEIRVRNRSGAATCAAYPVFLTFNEPGGEPQDAAGCADVSFNDPAVARGTYHCTAIIENPGKWQFTAYVNQPASAGQVQQLIAQKDVVLNFTDALKLGNESKGIKYVVTGSTFEVFLLQFHVVMATLWMLLAAALAFLAVPRLRRMLSVLALHTLEVRRGLLNSSLWATFGATLGTGLYLLGSKTAYEAPFSTNAFSFSAWEQLGNLPYAQKYFLVLYAKIVVFGLMAAASVILMLEAGRQAQKSQDSEGLDREDDDDMWSKGVHFDSEGHVLHDDDVAVAAGAVASVRRTSVKAQRRTGAQAGVSSRTLWACVTVLIIGAGAIGAAVTGLKYMHELIEMAAAAAIIRSGG